MFSSFFHDDLLNAWPHRVQLVQHGDNKHAPSDAPKPILPAMSLDLVERENEFSLFADLPGVDRADVDISINGGVLSISAKKENKHEDQTATSYYIERSSGSMQRSIRLPKNVDTSDVTASFDTGVLQVTLPKKAEAKPATIKVPIA